MKERLFLSVLISIICLIFNITGLNAYAEEIAVIVSADNPVDSLSLSEIKSLYENDKITWGNGSRVVLYDLPVKHEARKIFSIKVLGKDADRVAMEWANKKITNTAKNPPRIVKSDLLVQSKVAKDPNAIGYILKSKLKIEKVKVVAVIK